MRRWMGPALVAAVLLAGCGPVVRDVTVNPSALVAGEPGTVCAVVDWDSSHPAPMTWTLEASNNDVLLDRRSGSSDDLPCMTVIPEAPGTVRVEAKVRQEGNDGWESAKPVEVPVGDPLTTPGIGIYPPVVTPSPMVPNTMTQVQVRIDWFFVPDCLGTWRIDVSPHAAWAIGTSCDPAQVTFPTGGDDMIGKAYTITVSGQFGTTSQKRSTTWPVVAPPTAVAPAG